MIEVANKRRAVGRHADHAVAADHRAAFRVARMLHVLGGRRCLDDRTTQPTRKTNALAVYVSTRVAPQLYRPRKVSKLDADLLEYRFRVVLDQLEGLVVKQPEIGNLAVDPGGDRGDWLPTGGSLGFAAGAAPSRWSLAHTSSCSIRGSGPEAGRYQRFRSAKFAAE